MSGPDRADCLQRHIRLHHPSDPLLELRLDVFVPCAELVEFVERLERVGLLKGAEVFEFFCGLLGFLRGELFLLRLFASGLALFALLGLLAGGGLSGLGLALGLDPVYLLLQVDRLGRPVGVDRLKLVGKTRSLGFFALGCAVGLFRFGKSFLAVFAVGSLRLFLRVGLFLLFGLLGFFLFLLGLFLFGFLRFLGFALLLFGDLGLVALDRVCQESGVRRLLRLQLLFEGLVLGAEFVEFVLNGEDVGFFVEVALILLGGGLLGLLRGKFFFLGLFG